MTGARLVVRGLIGLVALVLVGLGMGLLRSGSGDQGLFAPSGNAITVPARDTDFDSYVADSRQRLTDVIGRLRFDQESAPYGDYSLQQVVEMRAPFERVPAADCQPGDPGAGVGYLLIHGLTDSPYLLRHVAARLHQTFPCARLRAPLMPGHGTVPGDLLKVHRDDWLRTVEWAAEGFRGQVDRLYLVGYSNGASLSLRHAQRHPEDPLLAGLILLSPGLAPRAGNAWLSPYVRPWVHWTGRDANADAAKYESLTMNAAAEFYVLTEAVRANSAPTLPTLMVLTADDTTVNAMTALDFLCAAQATPRRAALVYTSDYSPALPTACEGVALTALSVNLPRFVNHSHVAITVPQDDPHYGLDGRYPHCNRYREDADALHICRTDPEQTVYGEGGLPLENGRYQGKLVRRSTFNPVFSEAMRQIECFIDPNCGAVTR